MLSAGSAPWSPDPPGTSPAFMGSRGQMLRISEVLQDFCLLSSQAPIPASKLWPSQTSFCSRLQEHSLLNHFLSSSYFLPGRKEQDKGKKDPREQLKSSRCLVQPVLQPWAQTQATVHILLCLLLVNTGLTKNSIL